MSLRKIEKSDYSRFIERAKRCTANKVYPMSISEGYQEGDIFIDSEADANVLVDKHTETLAKEDFVMFWHYCGFVYFYGRPSAELLEEIYEYYLLRESERRFVIITDDETVKNFFSIKNDIVIDKRFEYAYDVPIHAVGIETSEAKKDKDSESQNDNELDDKFGISIERISEKNIGRIHGRIIPSFSWDISSAFLEKGLGYVATDGEKIAAVAFSSAVSSDEVDIGVETDPDYRRRGLSARLTVEMCEEIISMGKKPVWAHAAANVASGKTAERAGFTKTKENYVIRIG